MLRKLDGTELKDDETYTLVTSNYRATGTGGYECIGNCRSVGSYADEMPDLLVTPKITVLGVGNVLLSDEGFCF